MSSFAGQEWSKLSISSQIFNATENFWILPNFILRRSGVVKNLIFEPNFQHKSKRFCQISSSLNFEPTVFGVPRPLKMVKLLIFEPNFQLRLKISWFCQTSSFPCSEWSKCQFWAKFSWLKMSGFCQISSSAGLLKNVNFESNFQLDSKFLDFAKFHPSQVQSGQKSQFWAEC